MIIFHWPLCLQQLSRSDYTYLQLLLLMMILEINDILFFVKSLKELTDLYDISRFVTFCSGCTRLASNLKLKHGLVTTNNSTRNFYFNRLPRLWNSLPLIDISQSLSTIKMKLYKHFWNHFTANFDPDNLCSYHNLCPCANCSSLPVSYNFNTCLLSTFICVFLSFRLLVSITFSPSALCIVSLVMLTFLFSFHLVL